MGRIFRKPFTTPVMMRTLRVSLFGCLVWMLGCSSGFSQSDIADVQTRIKQDFEKKGFTVLEIKMSRGSEDTLGGFVRLRKNVPNIGDMDFSKVCTATKNPNTSQYSWKCEDR